MTYTIFDESCFSLCCL